MSAFTLKRTESSTCLNKSVLMKNEKDFDNSTIFAEGLQNSKLSYIKRLLEHETKFGKVLFLILLHIGKDGKF